MAHYDSSMPDSQWQGQQTCSDVPLQEVGQRLEVTAENKASESVSQSVSQPVSESVSQSVSQ